MRLCEEVRVSCAAIAESARDVAIDLSRVGEIKAGPEPELDPERHYLEGSAEDVALFTLTLDAINFGSGWFPTLRKRPGCSGYNTIAWALTDRFRADGPWSADELSALRAETVADVLGQERGHELMGLYAEALTIFADNLVPHVLRVDGVLRYSDELAAAIDAERLLPPGDQELEIRACAVVACEAIAADLGVPPRVLDNWLWNHGQQPRYKAIPRHRTRTTAY